MTDSERRSIKRRPRRSTRRTGFLNGWTAAALAAWAFLGIESLRPTPELAELAKVTATVERQQVDRTRLLFWLEGVEQKFVVDAEGVDAWYELVDACERGAELSLWTWPAVLEDRPWPLASFHARLPWQIECKGKLLVSYDEVHEGRSGVIWLLRSLFLALTAGLAWWRHRVRYPKAEEPRRRRKRKQAQDHSPDESQETDHGGRVQRWCWNLMGLAFAVMFLFAGARERSQDSYPVPERGDLVEKVGTVVVVEVDVRRGGSNSVDKILGFSFGLEGEQGRWAVTRRQWPYDLLARRLVPGASVRLLVLGPEWLADHGAPPPNEDLWSVAVGEEQVLSLEQQQSLVRKRRERKSHPLALALVAAIVSACLIQGYRVGRPRT